MTSLRGILRRCESVLAQADEPPRRTAAAFAVGVGLSFSPLLGLQILLAALLSWAFKLNRLVLFVGLCTNLPWIMAPYYAATTGAAAWLMGVAPAGQLVGDFAGLFSHSVLSSAFWTEVVRVLWPLFWPFVVGSSVAALAVAALAYRVGLALATARLARLERA
jgi:hypothetical protein